VVVTVTTTFKSGGDKSLPSNTKLRLWTWNIHDLVTLNTRRVFYTYQSSL